MNESQTMMHMVDAAREAAEWLDARPRIDNAGFDNWPGFKTAFESIDAPMTALLRTSLAAARPDATWADESDTSVSAAGEVWVVDAVDGAVQYLQGLPQWSVSVALVRDSQPVLAVLHSARLGETYTAMRGGGAYRNGVPISPSTKTDLSLALVGSSHPPLVRNQPAAVSRIANATASVVTAVGALRNFGPTSWQIGDVAAGRMDAFFQYGTDASNLIAGYLIATEADAVVTDAAGAAWQPSSDSFLAAPPSLHGQLVRLLSA